MVGYTEPLMRKKFFGATLSEAKTKALKWAGRYVVGNEKLGKGVSFSIDTVNDGAGWSAYLVVQVTIDEREVRERHCKICKEFHKLYFINENCNCSECKAMGYLNRMQEMIAVKKSYCRAMLKESIQQQEQEMGE